VPQGEIPGGVLCILIIAKNGRSSTKNNLPTLQIEFFFTDRINFAII